MYLSHTSLTVVGVKVCVCLQLFGLGVEVKCTDKYSTLAESYYCLTGVKLGVKWQMH